MRAEVFIERIGWSVGAIRRSVEESAAAGTLVSSASALREAGFAYHHVSAKDATAYDLARDAVETMRDGLGDIGAIAYATCIPLNSSIGDERRFRDSRDVKHLMDFPVSHLQTDFGLERATVLGQTQQACTGLLGSLRLARALLLSEPDVRRVLCLTADRFPEGALYEQSYNLITDGAAACIVTLEPGPWRLLAVHQITNGGLARATDEETAGSFFAFTHRAIQETLAKAGLSMKDIAWFVAQNMNRKAMEILARLLRFDPERITAPTMAEIAHVISGDNLINLKHMDDRGEIRPGERVLLSMAGYGLNWQCAVLERQ
jgi:3-oxoacyl-[acyl-carrier-protein] synthase-3